MRALILYLCLAVTAAAADLNDPGFVAELEATATGGGGGSLPAWFDIETTANENALNFTVSATTMAWQDVTIGGTGNATKLRIYNSFNFGSYNVKVGLYDSGGNRLQTQSAVSGSTDAYIELTISSQAVSAGTYKLAWIFDNGNASTAINNASGTISFNNAQTYSGGLPATLPSSTSTTTGKALVGVYVE
jgi:hypothetical protein